MKSVLDGGHNGATVADVTFATGQGQVFHDQVKRIWVLHRVPDEPATWSRSVACTSTATMPARPSWAGTNLMVRRPNARVAPSGVIARADGGSMPMMAAQVRAMARGAAWSLAASTATSTAVMSSA